MTCQRPERPDRRSAWTLWKVRRDMSSVSGRDQLQTVQRALPVCVPCAGHPQIAAFSSISRATTSSNPADRTHHVVWVAGSDADGDQLSSEGVADDERRDTASYANPAARKFPVENRTRQSSVRLEGSGTMASGMMPGVPGAAAAVAAPAGLVRCLGGWPGETIGTGTAVAATESGGVRTGSALGDGVAVLARASATATSGQSGSSRARLKSASETASVETPMSASRCSITSASCGRPASACARARRYISPASFLGPVWTARQARSWKRSYSPRMDASSASWRQSASHGRSKPAALGHGEEARTTRKVRSACRNGVPPSHDTS